MNEFEFDRLLDLYQKGLLNGKEKDLLENWLHQLDAGNGTPLTEADMARLKSNINGKIKHPAGKSRYWTTLKIAASVIIILSAGIWALNIDTGTKTISSNGTVTKAVLPDGTLVWLKGVSSLEAPAEFVGDTRKVILHGEALFEVTKDPNHPFVIESGKFVTTVLGTSFNLRSDDSQVELTVLTGKVSLRSCDVEKAVIVMPNEKVIYNNEKLLVSRENIAIEEKTATIVGTEYSMKFNDATLGEIFDRIENKFDVTVSLSDEALRDCVIRADFSDQSLNETMDMICLALGFQYTTKDKVVHLTGKACR